MSTFGRLFTAHVKWRKPIAIETIITGHIKFIHKDVGSTVKKDDIVMIIGTDKAGIDEHSPFDGIVTKIHYPLEQDFEDNKIIWSVDVYK